jgi:hypothetical protein
VSLIRNSPWFASLAGAAMALWALYVLLSGEIQIDKKGTFVATRAGEPLAYWLAWLFIALMAFLVCWHASRLWRKNA